MESFDSIRDISYAKYTAFSKDFGKYEGYNVEIHNVDNPIFKLGDCEFNILPVLSTLNTPQTIEITLFDQNRPDKLSFSQINEICSEFQVPKIVKTANNEALRLIFSLSAIVCNKVGGVSFLGASKIDGRTIWFVILSAVNEAGNKYLRRVERIQEFIDPSEAAQWYIRENI